MSTEMVSAWVDVALIDRLHQIRSCRPHSPTLRLVATRAIQKGLDCLDGPHSEKAQYRARPNGKRRAFTFRLSSQLYRHVLAACQKIPDVDTPSSALHLVLWLGVNRLLSDSESESGEAA